MSAKDTDFNATFGGLYSKKAGLMVLNAGDEKQLSLPSIMSSNNVILGMNTITIIENGVYRITDFISMRSADPNSVNITFSTRKNGQNMEDLYHTISVGNSFKEISSTAILPLRAGDIIDLVISSASGGSLFFGIGLSASLTVLKVA